ncbi:MAG TPA: MaoC family dehydratase [Steroidobacteraceae bacterium]|nr:MaoC family dehydratase [Steroidobacteraceae bacterium]
MAIEQARATLQQQIGREVHLSDWLTITQARIDAFAAATGDRQWIHVDAERAASESPWRRTIAHGYLTLSLFPLLRGVAEDGQVPYPGVRAVINYGINTLRFMNAVREGARIRGRSVLVAVEEFRGGIQVIEEMTVEIEAESKPACVAEVLLRLYF